jgi:hypothetical protein
MKLSRKKLRHLIESFISGRYGTVHIPKDDPGAKLPPKLKHIAQDRSNPSSVNQANMFANTLGYEGDDFSRDLGAYNTQGRGEYAARVNEMSIEEKIKHIERIVNEIKSNPKPWSRGSNLFAAPDIAMRHANRKIRIGSFNANAIYRIDSILNGTRSGAPLYNNSFKRKGVFVKKVKLNQDPQLAYAAKSNPSEPRSSHYDYFRLTIDY